MNKNNIMLEFIEMFLCLIFIVLFIIAVLLVAILDKLHAIKLDVDRIRYLANELWVKL